MTSDYLRPLAFFAAGVVSGGVLVAVWTEGRGLSAFADDNASEIVSTSTSQLVEDTSGTVSVVDQSAGGTVVVESVTVPPPGVWVAVREVEANGLGNVLGAARVRGPRSNVSIPLLRATQAGNTYAAVLYRDEGSDTFTLDEESSYVDFDSGRPVLMTFHIH